MDERRAPSELIERLVRDSNLPSRRAREELRRELESHFAEAGDSPEAIGAALARFGSADAVADGFRRAYRRGRVALYVAKVLASIVASTVVALALQLLVTVAAGHGRHALHLAPAHLRISALSLAVVLVAVAAWELGIEPLCGRLERHPPLLLATLTALCPAAYVAHLALNAGSDVGGAFVGAAVTVAIWISTIAILSRLETAYVRFFGRGQ